MDKLSTRLHTGWGQVCHFTDVGNYVGKPGDVGTSAGHVGSKKPAAGAGFIKEPTRGLEPLTYGLQNRCSAIELHRHAWRTRMLARVRHRHDVV